MRKTKKVLAVALTILMLVTTIPVGVIPASASSYTCFQQTDPRWADVKYGYSNEAGTVQAYIGKGAGGLGSGCGLLSLTNAVYYLTGNFLDPSDLATFSLSHGCRVNGVGTTWDFSKKAADYYGETYNFKYDGDSVYDKDLISHLQSGGVALAVVPNHFIAIVSYDSSNNSFLVI